MNSFRNNCLRDHQTPPSTVWPLDSFYQTEREQIAEGLRKVIISAGVHCAKQGEMLDALQRFASTKCDFLDCYLAALAAASGDHLATIWRRLIGILTALTMSNAGSSNGDRYERTSLKTHLGSC